MNDAEKHIAALAEALGAAREALGHIAREKFEHGSPSERIEAMARYAGLGLDLSTPPEIPPHLSGAKL